MQWQPQGLAKPSVATERLQASQLSKTLAKPTSPGGKQTSTQTWVRAGQGTALAAGGASTFQLTRLQPWFLSDYTTLSKVGIDLTVMGAACSWLLGVYKSDPATWRPSGAPAATYGPVLPVGAGITESAANQYTMAPGLWWVGWLWAGGAAGTTWNGWAPTNPYLNWPTSAGFAGAAGLATCLETTVAGATLPTLTSATVYTAQPTAPVVLARTSLAL